MCPLRFVLVALSALVAIYAALGLRQTVKDNASRDAEGSVKVSCNASCGDLMIGLCAAAYLKCSLRHACCR